MKKLLLLAILLINGSYLFSMEAEKEEVTKFEFEQLPTEIQTLIQKLGFDAAIQSANSIQEAIQNIYAIKQADTKWRDIWIDLMKNEQVTQYLFDKLFSKFHKQILQDLQPKTPIEKSAEKKYFGEKFILPGIDLFTRQFVLLLLGTEGAIKLLQKKWYSEPEFIDGLVKWYAYKKPDNKKTIAHLKDVAHKVTHFEQYSQLPQDIQKIIASYGLNISLLDAAIDNATTIQEAIENINNLKLNRTWKYAWENLLKNNKVITHIAHKILQSPMYASLLLNLTPTTEEQKKYFSHIFNFDAHPDSMSPNLHFLLMLMLGLDKNYTLKLSKEYKGIYDYVFNPEAIIKWYAYMKPQNVETIERLQSNFEKVFEHRVDLSDVPLFHEH